MVLLHVLDASYISFGGRTGQSRAKKGRILLRYMGARAQVEDEPWGTPGLRSRTVRFATVSTVVKAHRPPQLNGQWSNINLDPVNLEAL